MKLISFLQNKNTKEIKIGAHCGDYIVDFSSSSLPKDMISFIELGDKALSLANDLIDSQQNLLSVEEITLKAPITQPGKVLGVGLNYKEHLAEAKEIIEEQNRNIDLQEQYPNIFNKQNSSVAGPYDDVHRPNVSDQLDYEGEMGFIIGNSKVSKINLNSLASGVANEDTDQNNPSFQSFPIHTTCIYCISFVPASAGSRA